MASGRAGDDEVPGLLLHLHGAAVRAGAELAEGDVLGGGGDHHEQRYLDEIVR